MALPVLRLGTRVVVCFGEEIREPAVVARDPAAFDPALVVADDRIITVLEDRAPADGQFRRVARSRVRVVEAEPLR